MTKLMERLGQKRRRRRSGGVAGSACGNDCDEYVCIEKKKKKWKEKYRMESERADVPVERPAKSTRVDEEEFELEKEKGAESGVAW
jgi:hypothetical protein